MLILSGAWLILAVFLLKVEHFAPENFALILGFALFFPVTALIVSILRPIRPLTAAQIIDRRLGLKDRIGSAYDFVSRGSGNLSPYAESQVKDAAKHAEQVNVRKAMPYRFPRRILFFFGQLIVALIVVLLPAFPEPEPVQAALPPQELEGMTVEFDELDGFNDFLRDVHQDALDEELDEVAQAAEEFNKLLQDLADQKLPYRDALERIADLEQKLARDPWKTDPEAEQFLKQIGRDLMKSKISKKTGEALQKNELRKARDESRKMAEKMKREPPSKRRLDELKRAVKRAAKRQPPDYEQRMKKLKQKQRRLKQKNKKNKSSARNKRRLKKNQRELERLQRNLEKHRQKQRQLERLQRDLQKMSESLNMQSSPELQQLMEQLSEDINRMARDQSSEQQMQNLRQRLEELRRLLQQLKRGGKGFKLRLSKFNKGARGGKSCPWGQGGKSGKGGMSMGKGGKGSGLLLLRKRGISSGGSKQGGKKQGGGKGGKKAGTGHDKNLRGDQNKLKGQFTDIQVSPTQGKGPSRSQVIRTAADQGFSSEGYGKVHKMYERQAESLLEKQDIPPGYRRYIRLYFERIRPR